MAAAPDDEPDDLRSVQPAVDQPRVRLRALYAAAMSAVSVDPKAALADYEQSLADLIAARRRRGD